MNLTPIQTKILQFIREFIAKHNYSPSFREIQQAFTYSSLASVHKHILNLQKKGMLHYHKGFARSIQIIQKPFVDNQIVELPIIGELQFGYPIEMFSSIQAKLPFSKSLIPNIDQTYALQIRGHEGRSEGIYNQDIILVEASPNPQDGDIVIVQNKNRCCFIRRYSCKEDSVYLDKVYPDHMDHFELEALDELSIEAVGIFLLRNFHLQ